MLKSTHNKKSQNFSAVYQIKEADRPQSDAYTLQRVGLEPFLELPPHGQKQALMATAHHMQTRYGQDEIAGATYCSVLAQRISDTEMRYWTFNLGDVAAYFIVLDDDNTVVEASVLNPIHRVHPEQNADKYERIAAENRSRLLPVQGARLSRALGSQLYQAMGLSHQPQMTRGDVALSPKQRVFIIVSSNALKDSTQSVDEQSAAIGKIVSRLVTRKAALSDLARQLATHTHQIYAANTTVAVLEITLQLSSVLVVSGHGSPRNHRIAPQVAEHFYPTLQKCIVSLQKKYQNLLPLSQEVNTVGVCRSPSASGSVTVSDPLWHGFAGLQTSQRIECLHNALSNEKNESNDAAFCAAMAWQDANGGVHVWLAHWQTEQKAYLIIREKHGDKVVVDIIDLCRAHPSDAPMHIQEECRRLAESQEALLFVTSHEVTNADDVFNTVLYNHPHAAPRELALELCNEAFRYKENRDLTVACYALTAEPTSVLIANAAAQAKMTAFYAKLTQSIDAVPTASQQCITQAKAAVWLEALMEQYRGKSVLQQVFMSDTPPDLLGPLHLYVKNFYSRFGADTLDVQALWQQLRIDLTEAIAAVMPKAMQFDGYIRQLRQHINTSPTFNAIPLFKQHHHQAAKLQLAQVYASLNLMDDWALWVVEYQKTSHGHIEWRISFEQQWHKLNEAVAAYYAQLSANGSRYRKLALEQIVDKPGYQLQTRDLGLDFQDTIDFIREIAAKLPQSQEHILLQRMTVYVSARLGALP